MIQAQNQSLAVEIKRGEDHLDIWVDANNNGLRDDDDVNIFITAGGTLYTESVNFKGTLDSGLRDKLREVAVAYMKSPSHDMEMRLSALAHELVVKAITPQDANAPVAPVFPIPQ